MMQMPWVMASTVCSHSRLALESSSTSRAFSSPMATWAATAPTMSKSRWVNAWDSPAETDTAPMSCPAATTRCADPRFRRVGAERHPDLAGLGGDVAGEQQRPAPEGHLEQGIVDGGGLGRRIVGDR